MRSLTSAAACAVALSACSPQVPDSGAGVGFGDYNSYRSQREADLAGRSAATPPPGAISDERLAQGTEGERLGAEALAAIGQGSTARRGSVDDAAISDEQDFAAVSARESIESDRERLERQRAAYQVVQPTALPARTGSSGPNIVQYALSTTNAPGQQVHRRGGLGGASRYDRACAKYASPDLAQEAFLAAGGPERDKMGLDPDGDGFACAWESQAVPSGDDRGAVTPVRRLSPNFGDRRGGATPELVVIHYTGMVDCAEALDRLCDPDVEVSAHYLIGREGTLWQLVDEADRAWHAGAGSWRGAGDVNSRSIGIELDNPGNAPFSEPQMAELENLLAELLERWSIPIRGVIGHSDMAPGRKTDPGPRFDWRRLSRQGFSLWPDVNDAGEAPDNDKFLASVGRFGYATDSAAETVLNAFRLRFRPWASGPLDRVDMALAAALDVDGGGTDA